MNKKRLNNLLVRTKGSSRIAGDIGEKIAYEVLVRGLHFDIYHPPSIAGCWYVAPQPQCDILESEVKHKMNYEKEFWGEKYESIKDWKNPYFADLVIKKGNEICFVEVKSNVGQLARARAHATISLFKTATDKERVRFQLNSFKDWEDQHKNQAFK